jgi:hypothetical protein
MEAGGSGAVVAAEGSPVGEGVGVSTASGLIVAAETGMTARVELTASAAKIIIRKIAKCFTTFGWPRRGAGPILVDPTS